MRKIIFFKLWFLTFVAFTNSTFVLEDSLLTAFKNKEKVNILVDLISPDNSLKRLQLQRADSREEQLENVVSSLQSYTKTSQTNVIKLLEERSMIYLSFWISNQIYIENATEEIVHSLSKDPGVEKIAEEVIIQLDPIEILQSNQTETKQSIQWGITKIGADNVWNVHNRRGEGIVVGGIDTGVRYTHEALSSNYRSQFGWANKMLNEQTTRPFDDNGHGTHTMGTIVGQNGIGVAPGAKWIACRACNNNGCPGNALLGCAEFMLCPSGNSRNCQAPHVVSNSWGGGKNTNWFNRAIQSWIAAGIVPVFSIGNEGREGCSSASSPGDQLGDDLLSVGSTTINDVLSVFSSRGPANGKIKPFISAPGDVVRSAYYTSDYAYEYLSGTSMACPHVSGAVALLLSEKQLNGSSYQNLMTSIREGADTTGLTPPSINCDGINRNYPNNAFGHGRLNVTASLLKWRISKPSDSSSTQNTITLFLPIFMLLVISFFQK